MRRAHKPASTGAELTSTPCAQNIPIAGLHGRQVLDKARAQVSAHRRRLSQVRSLRASACWLVKGPQPGAQGCRNSSASASKFSVDTDRLEAWPDSSQTPGDQIRVSPGWEVAVPDTGADLVLVGEALVWVDLGAVGYTTARGRDRRRHANFDA